MRHIFKAAKSGSTHVLLGVCFYSVADHPVLQVKFEQRAFSRKKRFIIEKFVVEKKRCAKVGHPHCLGTSDVVNARCIRALQRYFASRHALVQLLA
jgi:hypothetical protein